MRVVAKYFKNLENLVASQYDITPSSHSGDKGEDREEFLIKILNCHLPRAATAYRGGEILGCWDRKSNQADIVRRKEAKSRTLQARKEYNRTAREQGSGS